MTISSRIYLGFGSVLALTMVLAVVSYWGIQNAEKTFASYRKLARQTNADGRVQANMLMTRIFAKNFVIDANQSNIEGVQRRAEQTLDMIRETRTLAGADPARSILLQDLEENLQRYVAKFEEVTRLQARRDELVINRLNILGPKIEEALTSIMTSAARDGDAAAAYQAGTTLRNVLLGRLYSNRFLVENNDESHDRAIREFRNAEINCHDLTEQLTNSARKALADEAQNAQRAYMEAFDEVHETIGLRNSIIQHELDRIGPDVAQRIEDLKLAIKAEQDVLGPAAEETLTRSVVVSILVSGLVILLGVMTAFVIGAGISRPIRALTEAAVAMGDGDLQQDIDIDRSDEIGVLAQSMAAMRDSIMDKVSTLQREVVERRRAEKELAETHQNLEVLVAERTSELAAARDDAEQATRAKAEFLASMSHEIRTPMNGVIGMVDLLRQTKMSRDQREMLTTVRSSAYGLLTIINDILDFSKIDAGKLILESEPFSLCDLVESVTETLTPSANEKGVSLHCFVDPSIPPTLLGDAVRLRQILFNLGGNAVKFTESGFVRIRADKLPLSDPSKVGLRLQVSDSGIGIAHEALDTLFEAFHQAESSTTRRFGGTGLGLTISHRLIEMMGGEIDVESTEGVGSDFSVTLTLPVAAVQQSQTRRYDLTGVRALLVERDPFVAEALLAYLRAANAEVARQEDLGQVESTVGAALESGRPFDVVWMGLAELSERVERIQSIQTKSDADAEAVAFVVRSERHTSWPEGLERTTAVVLDPVKRAGFLRAMAAAVGRASPDIDYGTLDNALPQGIVAPSVEEAEAAGRLVLLAEDNATNQKVLVRQLNSLGFAVVVAGDGEAALEALDDHEFVALLADCHMPRLDGLGLCRKIRQAESASARRRLPIIAVTAGVLAEEVEQCFEAGMDDFLPKPVETSKLHSVLGKWVPRVGLVEPTVVPESAPPRSDEPIDLVFLLEIFDGDLETVVEVARDFVLPSQQCKDEILAAVGDRSYDGIQAGCHKLKSAASTIGANRLAGLCEVLEKKCEEKADWSSVASLAASLDSELVRVIESIQRL